MSEVAAHCAGERNGLRYAQVSKETYYTDKTDLQSLDIPGSQRLHSFIYSRHTT